MFMDMDSDDDDNDNEDDVSVSDAPVQEIQPKVQYVTVPETKPAPNPEMPEHFQLNSIFTANDNASMNEVLLLRQNFFSKVKSACNQAGPSIAYEEEETVSVPAFEDDDEDEKKIKNMPKFARNLFKDADIKNDVYPPSQSVRAKSYSRDKARLPNEVPIRPEEAIIEGPSVNYDDQATVKCSNENMKIDAQYVEGTLHDIGLMDEIISNLKEMGVRRLRKIQQYVIPYMLNTTQDMIVSARTGNGKTMSYLIPIINQIAQENRKNPPTKRKPRVAILLQNHETANQVYFAAKKIANGLELGIIPAIGNNTMENELRQLTNNGGDIIIGTTGRFIQYVSEVKIPLDKLKTLIFDEADQFVKDRNWEESMSVFDSRTPKDRRTLLFSATYDDKACLSFNNFVKDYWFIAAGELNQVEILIRQNFVVIDALDSSKYVMELLKEKAVDGRCPKTLIFANSVEAAEWLTARLRLCMEIEMSLPFRVASLHSKLPAKDREMSFNCFLFPSTHPDAIDIIVASDKICCGVSTPAEIVINYEIPSDVATYILRVGRTGRNGHSGEAYTFIDPKELDNMGYDDQKILCSMIAAAKQTDVTKIPDVLESFYQKFVTNS